MRSCSELQKIIDSWPRTPSDAIAIQDELRQLVRVDRLTRSPDKVAGVDVTYGGSFDSIAVAACVVLELPSLATVEKKSAIAGVDFPYMPGLFAFRELPAILCAIADLKAVPEVIICDGHGLAHPRRFGLASHLGVLLDIPTIGVAKNRLTGVHAEPGCARGDTVPLTDRGQVIGAVLRTQAYVRPVYVSVGHKITLREACDLVLDLSPSFRLPETTRAADQLSRHVLKELIES